jgi:hypothetical protein
MKNIALLALPIAALAGAPALAADDNQFEYIENNINLKHGAFGYSLRTYIDKEPLHHEGTYSFSNSVADFTVGFRFAQDAQDLPELDALNAVAPINQDIREYRTFVQVDSLKFNAAENLELQFTPRLEYRAFDVDAGPFDREDYFRFRAAGTARYTVGNWQPWAGVEFFNDVSNAEFEQSRYMVGVNYKVNDNIAVGPYVETRLTNDWEENFSMVATQLNVSF